jgi:hypothetical protein
MYSIFSGCSCIWQKIFYQTIYQINLILHPRLRRCDELLNCFLRPRSDDFVEDDVIVVPDSIVAVENNTVVDVVVNVPGDVVPVSAMIVENALYRSIQEDNATTITNINLAIVNVPQVSINQRDNSITVRLQNSFANEVCCCRS